MSEATHNASTCSATFCIVCCPRLPRTQPARLRRGAGGGRVGTQLAVWRTVGFRGIRVYKTI